MSDNNPDDFDALSHVFSMNVEVASEDDLKQLVLHLRTQLQSRYMYLIGEWRNAHRAKSTRTGQFVSADEVRDYLTQGIRNGR